MFLWLTFSDLYLLTFFICLLVLTFRCLPNIYLDSQHNPLDSIVRSHDMAQSIMCESLLDHWCSVARLASLIGEPAVT